MFRIHGLARLLLALAVVAVVATAQITALEDALAGAEIGEVITLEAGVTYTATTYIVDETYDGGFEVSFLVDKPLTVLCEDTDTTATLDGEGLRRTLHINSGLDEAVHLSGLTITRGYYIQGAGMFALNSMITMEDCMITDNHAWSSSGKGGGATFKASVVKMTRTAVTLNKSDGNYGAAGLYFYTSKVLLESCHILSNIVDGTGPGGGLRIEASVVDVIDCVIKSNEAAIGGGVSADSDITYATVNMRRCAIFENQASNAGGGVALVNAAATMEDCRVHTNKAKVGGGVHVKTSSLIAKVTDFSMNEATWDSSSQYGGGGIYVESTISPNVHILASSFSANTAATGADIFKATGWGPGSVSLYDVCPAGYWGATSLDGALNTQGSINGAAVSIDPDSCTACQGGKALSSSGGQSAADCYDCDSGSYSAPGSKDCAPCPTGYFTLEAASAACQACAEGTATTSTGSTDSETCSTCTPGTYLFKDAVSGATSCRPCAAGNVNTLPGEESVAACEPCPEGLTSIVGGTSCFDPSARFYNMFIMGSSTDALSMYSRNSANFEPLTETGSLTNPSGLVFVSSDTALVSSTNSNEVHEIKYDGTHIGVFATVEEPRGLLFLPHLEPPQVAVCTQEYQEGAAWNKKYRRTLFFDVEGGLGGGNYRAANATGYVEYPVSNVEQWPTHLALHGNNQIVIGYALYGLSKRIYLACVPNTECKQPVTQIVEKMLAYPPPAVATIPSQDLYLVIQDYIIRSCPITWVADVFDCPIFAYSADVPDHSSWEPTALLVDAEQELVFVADTLNELIHAFGYSGAFVASTPAPVNTLAMAFKSGVYAPLSQITPPQDATTIESLSFTVSLRDRLDQPLAPDHDTSFAVSHLSITATGVVDAAAGGHQLPLTIDGEITSTSSAIDITTAGEWTIDVTENLNSLSSPVDGSPYLFTVLPGPTHAPKCQLSFEQTIVAGTPLNATVSTFDVHNNPAHHPEDELTASINDDLIPLTHTADNEYTFSTTLTTTGTYFIGVSLSSTPELVGGAEEFLKIVPASPDASLSTHNLQTTTLTSGDEPTLLELHVSPHDEFGNVILEDARGYSVQINDLPSTPLSSNSTFSHTHSIPPNYKGPLILSFMLNSAPIKDSPVTIAVAPAPAEPISPAIIAGVVVAFLSLTLMTLVLNRRQKKKATRDVVEMAQAGMAKMSKMANQQQALEEQNEGLRESLRKKKHSADELAVMKAAMTNVSTERQEELKGVLIPSSKVKIDRLIGKGGFGVVNLATYNGQLVAMKQLLSIDNDSVKRFRFECFLMKNLRHPNIVKLVGVCWDDSLFACCLEYVSNGSVDDWLKNTLGMPQDVSLPRFGGLDDKKKNVNFTWKDKRLRMMTECALGVQYLHNERYWFDGDYKDGKEVEAPGWRDCIIHRDLKPDNMLLTEDWQLKLTDFGEARAADLNNTMTSVGTPIYIAPEIMRADHYDSKADVYSFGVCLVAMINAEKNVAEFFFECLRKHMKKTNRRGVGMAILNNRILNQGWKPNLPAAFVQAYPKLGALIRRCWTIEREPRPDFDEIVKLLQGDVADEVRRVAEPDIQQLGDEPDDVYWEEAKRLECKEEEQVEEEVSEIDLMKEKYGAMRAKYASVTTELEAMKKAGKMEEEVVEEAATERKVVKSAHGDSNAKVLPILDAGTKKKFGELSTDEFYDLLKQKGLGVALKDFRTNDVKAQTVDDPKITEEDVSKLGDFSALIQRKLVKVIKAAIAEGETEGAGGRRKS